MDEFKMCCYICTIIVSMVTLFAVSLDYLTGKIECSAKAKTIGYKCEYHYFSGCVLEKPNGKKILLQQLREFAE